MPSKTPIHVVHISETDQDKRNVLIAFISLQEAQAVEEEDDGLTLYDVSRPFLENITRDLVRRGLIDELSLRFEELEDVNWNAQWESSFEPVLIDDYCNIRASFHPPRQDVTFDLVINPEMAFGTGHHETTSLMIRQMKDMDFKDQRVLDFGCGTAILSILAEKLGAASVLGIDHDQQALECAASCLSLNGACQVVLSAEPIETCDQQSFEIILANINRNVLQTSVQHISACLVEGGHVLLSGILSDDVPSIVELYARFGLVLSSKMEENNWVCLRLIKNSG